MSTLSLKNINKIYDNNVQAVFDFNLDIKNKEFIVFVGPSGCGKSTTLRMVAGLEEITSGELYIDGKIMNAVAPKDRDIAMVFQNYALYPHMTVYDNMAFALKLRKMAMPIYEFNEEVNELYRKNKEIFNKIHSINRAFKRNQNNLKLLEPRARLFKEIYANLSKIEKLRKPVMGKNEYQIAKLQKTLLDLNNEVNRLNNLLKGKYSDKPEMIKTIQGGIAQRKEQIEITKKDLAYYQTHDVPLTKLRNLTSKEIEIEVNRTAESIDLVRYLFRKPSALSGGQRQRVALGRAIVRKPYVFLMDEPLSNLDAKLRVQTRSEIIKIHERVGATTIYVTHDQTEAMTMADRIVIMKDGWIQQIGSPVEVYNDPANTFVAGFIGSPAMNFLNVKIEKGYANVLFNRPISEDLLSSKITKADIQIKLTENNKKLLSNFEGKEVVLGIRPESIYLKGDKNNANPSVPIKLNCDFSELLGYELVLYMFLNGQKIIAKTDAKNNIKSHDDITICFDKEKMYFFEKETGKRIK